MGDLAKQYSEAVLAAGFELKGKNNLYTSHNGHMFSFLGKDRVLAVRLSPDDKKAYVVRHRTGDVIQYNSVMRGYVPVLDKIADDPKAFAKLLKQGFKYVDSLPPKPTKQK